MVRAVLAIALFVFAGAPAFAQTSTLSGVVLDSAGGVIPGADIVIKHIATGVTTAGVSNSEGQFNFPGVQVGTYTVTVTLQGFKTFVANDVVLSGASPASVKAVLEVGGVTETVTVSSSSEIIQTQASTVSNTVSMNQILKLPLTSRSGMDFVNFLPGVSTPGGNRSATINGLPRGMINITLDGVNIQDNTLRSTDGFFAIVSPRLDAIEEVTVSTASQGADGTGQGAVQIRFVTRSGSNDYTGSLYWTRRHDSWNANTWFNNRDGIDKAKLRQSQPGGRVGGPITIPGLFDGRNKAFFFVNYEEFREPRGVTRTRTIFHPRAEQGFFRYGSREVDVLSLAAANGHTSTMDPIIASTLAAIRSATATTGSVRDATNPLTQQYTFNVPVESVRHYPTVRVDYNVTEAHRLTSSFNYQKFADLPDTLNNRDEQFPGFPIRAGQSSVRKSWSNSLRSNFGGNFVNELRVAYAGAPVAFFAELNKEMWSSYGGFNLAFPLVTSPGAAPAPQGRNAYNWLIEDSVNWLKGSHSITMGGNWNQFTIWARNSSLLPTVNFGMVTADPAQSMFNLTNFPGASAADLANARAYYALLTGRVSTINGDARLENGQYVYMGTARQEARMEEASLFIQDSWRWKPNFTINVGLRYELQFPFFPLNDSYSTATVESICGVSGVNPNSTHAGDRCNLFQPGVMPGSRPEYINFGKGVKAFNTDYNNFAPNIGFAWVLGERSGILGTILGDESVLRGGYSKSYSREGMNQFTGQYSANPGINLFTEPDRSEQRGNLGALPLLFRDTSRLGPAPFPASPLYPFQGTIDDQIAIIDENIQVPWAESLSLGIQRALGRNHVLEVRYVGTRGRDTWTNYQFNEPNILETGFVDEFRRAQANLQANLAAGRGATFAYTGIPGTSPLPIYLAHFRGAGDPNNPALYTSSLFTSATFVTPLARFNPNVLGAVGSLFNDPTRRANAAAAGYPANFWVANPDKFGGAFIEGNGGKTDFNSLQVELRRRLFQGLQFQSNYVFGIAKESNRFSFRTHRQMRKDTGDPGNIEHALKANVVYDLPFGRGRKFASNAGAIMERIVGGWSLGFNVKVQSGRMINLGNVQLVGMSESDIQSLYKLRIDATGRVYMFPAEIINESIKAFSTSATSVTGYSALGAPTGRYFAPAGGPDCLETISVALGDCGTGDLVVTGPMFQQYDLAVSKRIALFGRTNLELRAEALNAFNNVNFVPVGGVGSTLLTGWEVGGLTGTNTSRTLQLIGRFNF